MSKLRMGLYGFLGALLSVAIWGFIGGCQSNSGDASAVSQEIDQSDSFSGMNESLSVGESIPGESTPGENLPEEAPPATSYTPPRVSEVNIPVKESAPSGESPSGPVQTYTVKKGDTIWGISRSYGVKMKALTEVNNLDRPDSLKIGQKLIIPGKAEN